MAADDNDEMMEPDEEIELEETDELVDDLDGPDLDEEELGDDLEEPDDEFGIVDDDIELADDEEDDEAAAKAGPVRKSVASEDEDEDEDMLAPDDVEADLDTILKDRLVAADDEGDEDEEEPEERGESADRLQPKRADEQLCPSCFLLVRQSAPMCPVGDDDCPLFSR